MDGTPGGYYFERATAAESSTKWVFDLEGGGECVTKWSCLPRLLTSLGSSKHFSRARDLRFLSSGDQEENPHAHTWNRVFVPYCSQDLWSGTRLNRSADTWELYFSGHVILEEVVKALLASSGLKDATDVVVTGESAGGIGSWINAGWFKRQLAGARTVVAPVAGFYAYAFPYTGPSATPPGLADFGPNAWQHHYGLWQSHVDEDCKEAFPENPWFCMIANNSRPWIDVPAFVVEAQTDQVQLEAHDDIPKQPWSKLPGSAQASVEAYVRQWKANMTSNIHSRLRPSDGYFFAACYIHTGFSKKGPFIDDPTSNEPHTYSQAFGKWHAALGTPAASSGFRLEDACPSDTLFCGQCQGLAVPGAPVV